MNTVAAATSSGLFLATIYNRSQLEERKHVARYWSISTAVSAVPLIAHPSPTDVATGGRHSQANVSQAA